MANEDITLIALSGYTEYGRVSKKDYNFHMSLPSRIISSLMDDDSNLRSLKNNTIILFNVFESKTAKHLLLDCCPDQIVLRLNALLLSINRSSSIEYDKEYYRRLEDV